ncbi:MAG TPA: hypothetical protein VMW69_10605 [Spirochaetia bacterium]|nr:hypothetical protein [Spirochaetia bacterium]
MDEKAKEVISNLNSEWHKLKHGNPIPSFYPQSGAETVMVRGASEIVGGLVVTNYEIVVTDEGEVVGTYTIRAEESVDKIKDF